MSDTEENKVAWFILVIYLILCCLSYFVYFFIINDFKLSNDTAVWAQFGDYIGGVLNPAIAIFAVIWVAKSFSMQLKELDRARLAFIKTGNQFENQKKISALTTSIEHLGKQIETKINLVQKFQAHLESEGLGHVEASTRFESLKYNCIEKFFDANRIIYNAIFANNLFNEEASAEFKKFLSELISKHNETKGTGSDELAFIDGSIKGWLGKSIFDLTIHWELTDLETEKNSFFWDISDAILIYPVISMLHKIMEDSINMDKNKLEWSLIQLDDLANINYLPTLLKESDSTEM